MKARSLRTLFFGVALVALIAGGIGVFLPFALSPDHKLALKISLWILLAAGITMWVAAMWMGGKFRRVPK